MDAFSLVSVNSMKKDAPSYCHLELIDTVLYDLQDGVKIMLPPLGSRGSMVTIERTQIELYPRDRERPSHAFCQVGGQAVVRRKIIHHVFIESYS